MREITKEFQEKVRAYLQLSQMTQKELAERVGVTPQQLGRWLKAKWIGKVIQTKHAQQLSFLFKNTHDSPDAHRMPVVYQADAGGNKSIGETKQAFNPPIEAEPYAPDGMKSIPLLGMAQAKSFGDDWRDWLDSNQNYESILVEDQGRELISFRVTGESMAPVVNAGDILIVDPTDALIHDRLAFLVCDEGAFVKWFDKEEKGVLYFSSQNHGGLSISIPNDHLIFAASVMEVRRIAPKRMAEPLPTIDDLKKTNKIKRGTDL